MEFKKTPFGKEREDLIVEHQRIIEEEKEKENINIKKKERSKKYGNYLPK